MQDILAATISPGDYQAPIPDVSDRPTVSKFFAAFFWLYIVMIIGGELVYDGEFSAKNTEPHAIVRACVKTFRAHPLSGSFTANVTRAAEPLEGAKAVVAEHALKDSGFTLRNETSLFAGKLTYNDGVIDATRDASHFWPEILRQDMCAVRLFTKDNQITGVSAEAVRTMK